MIAYVLCNQYLAGIHTGIQGGHAVEQMWGKYVGEYDATGRKDPNTMLTLLTFSRHFKTFVFLNGGDHEMLCQFEDFLIQNGNLRVPFCAFREPGLNNAVTAVAVLLRSYEASMVKAYLERGDEAEEVRDMIGTPLYELIVAIAKCPLAK